MRDVRLIGILAICWAAGVGCAPGPFQEEDQLTAAVISDFKDDALCRKRGFKEGEPAYKLCRADLARSRSKDATLFALP